MVNRYLKYLSSTGKRYGADSAEPILPFLLADVMYQEHNKYVVPAGLKHRMKEMDNTWRQAYRQFNMSFFCAFPRDEWEEITDLMDSLTDAVSNDIVVIRSKLFLIMEDVPFEDKQIVSALLVCHIFAQYAQIAWGNVYKTETLTTVGRVKKPNKNRHLEILKDISFKMAVEYFKKISNGVIRLSELEIDGTFRVIANHIYGWIKQNSSDGKRVDE